MRTVRSARALPTLALTGVLAVGTAAGAVVTAAPAGAAPAAGTVVSAARSASDAAVSYAASSSAVTAKATASVVARGRKVIKIGKRYRGIPYRAGGTSPSTGFDCSGFTQFVYRQVGVTIPRVSRDQARFARTIPRSQAVRGDLVFFHDSSGTVYHAALYAGRGRVLHSPHTGTHVKIEQIWASSVTFGRV